MLEESARVVETAEGYLWVETKSRSACARCASSSCTTSVISKLFMVRHNLLQLENSLGAKKGQQVVIGIPDDLLVKASVWAYLLPLLIMLIITALAKAIGMHEVFQSLIALGGLAVGFLIVHRANQGFLSRSKFTPQLLRIVNQQEIKLRGINI